MRVSPAADAAPGDHLVAVSVEHRGQTVRDLVQVRVAGPVLNPGGIDVHIDTLALALRPGERDTVRVELASTYRSPLDATLELLGPVDTWPLLPQWTVPVRLDGDDRRTVELPVVVPAGASRGTGGCGPAVRAPARSAYSATIPLPVNPWPTRRRARRRDAVRTASGPDRRLGGRRAGPGRGRRGRGGPAARRPARPTGCRPPAPPTRASSAAGSPSGSCSAACWSTRPPPAASPPASTAPGRRRAGRARPPPTCSPPRPRPARCSRPSPPTRPRPRCGPTTPPTPTGTPAGERWLARQAFAPTPDALVLGPPTELDPATLVPELRGRPNGPVHSGLGWHRLVVDAVRPAGPVPYEQVRPEIEAELTARATQLAFARWLDEAAAGRIRLAPGFEHPADPRQPDATHRH